MRNRHLVDNSKTFNCITQQFSLATQIVSRKTGQGVLASHGYTVTATESTPRQSNKANIYFIFQTETHKTNKLMQNPESTFVLAKIKSRRLDYRVSHCIFFPMRMTHPQDRDICYGTQLDAPPTSKQF